MPSSQVAHVAARAFQMTEARRWDNSEWPEWLNKAWNAEIGEPGCVWCDPDPPHTFLHLSTSEGLINIQWGDWIIMLDGEIGIYPGHTLEPAKA